MRFLGFSRIFEWISGCSRPEAALRGYQDLPRRQRLGPLHAAAGCHGGREGGAGHLHASAGGQPGPQKLYMTCISPYGLIYTWYDILIYV